MNLQNRIGKLEGRASDEDEECPHLPPLVTYPDGRVLNESTHDCGRARTHFRVVYTDGISSDLPEGMADASHQQ